MMLAETGVSRGGVICASGWWVHITFAKFATQCHLQREASRFFDTRVRGDASELMPFLRAEACASQYFRAFFGQKHRVFELGRQTAIGGAYRPSALRLFDRAPCA